jgi:hypothetical protein
MSRSTPVALFVCEKVAPTLEMAYAVQALRDSDKIRPLVLLGSESLRDQLPSGLFAGCDVLLFTKVLRPFPTIDVPRVYGLLARAARLFRAHVVADYLLVRRSLSQGAIVFRKLFRSYPIKAVLIPDDRSLSADVGLVAAAKRHGITTITVPFALSDPDADALRRSKDRSFSVTEGAPWDVAIKKKLCARLPQNIRDQDGKKLMFLTAGQAIALDREGLFFPVPWAYGGGVTDIACVYGRAIKDMQIRLGVPADKLEVTGQCSMDVLYRDWTKQLRSRQADGKAQSKGRATVLFAMPQFLEHGMLNEKQHTEVYDAVFRSLAAMNADIVLSLHPRADRRNYEGLAKKHGLSISDKRLIDLLPKADIFAATASSTLRWAVLMHIPTVVLDLFSIGPGGMYANGMFRLAHSVGEFIRSVSELVERPDLRLQYVRHLAETSCDLDPFDGHNTERLRSLIEARCADAGQPLGT